MAILAGYDGTCLEFCINKAPPSIIGEYLHTGVDGRTQGIIQ